MAILNVLGFFLRIFIPFKFQILEEILFEIISILQVSTMINCMFLRVAVTQKSHFLERFSLMHPLCDNDTEIRYGLFWSKDFHHHSDIFVFLYRLVTSTYCLKISIQNFFHSFSSISTSFKYCIFQKMRLEIIYIIEVINVPNLMFVVPSKAQQSYF